MYDNRMMTKLGVKEKISIELSLTTDIQSLKYVKQYGKELATRYLIDSDKVFEYVLCIDEIFTNCIIHAYQGTVGEVSVKFLIEDGCLSTQIRDYGSGISREFEERLPQCETSILECSGRGLFLVDNLSTELKIERCKDGGTQVEFYFERMWSR